MYINSEPWRPAAYFVWEDVTAVDGGGGAAFRAQLDARYCASPPFRAMCRNLGFLLGFGAIALLGIEIGVTFSGANEDVIYRPSMAIAVTWAGVGATVTICYARWALSREHRWWPQNMSKETL